MVNSFILIEYLLLIFSYIRLYFDRYKQTNNSPLIPFITLLSVLIYLQIGLFYSGLIGDDISNYQRNILSDDNEFNLIIILLKFGYFLFNIDINIYLPILFALFLLLFVIQISKIYEFKDYQKAIFLMLVFTNRSFLEISLNVARSNFALGF